MLASSKRRRINEEEFLAELKEIHQKSAFYEDENHTENAMIAYIAHSVEIIVKARDKQKVVRKTKDSLRNNSDNGNISSKWQNYSNAHVHATVIPQLKRFEDDDDFDDYTLMLTRKAIIYLLENLLFILFNICCKFVNFLRTSLASESFIKSFISLFLLLTLGQYN